MKTSDPYPASCRTRSCKLGIVAVILSVCLLVACAGSTRGTPWQSLPLDNGSLEIHYEEPNFAPFAPHTLYFYLQQNGETRLLASRQLRNDGANLGDHNIEFREVGNGLWEIRLRGAEQADEVWIVEQKGGEVTLTIEE